MSQEPLTPVCPFQASESTNPNVITQDDLAKMTGYMRGADISAELHRQGVPHKVGRRGIWTTVDALNAALGVRPGEPFGEPVSF